MIEWLYREGDDVVSPEAARVLHYLGQAHPERMPLWAAHWLVRGYDGEHLVHRAGLYGDDPREVGDVLPAALGRSREKLAAVVRDVCQEQVAWTPDASPPPGRHGTP